MTTLRIAPLLLVLLASALNSRPAVAQAPDYALGFDGASDYVTLGQGGTMIGAGWQTTKTLSLWVRPTGAPYCSAQDPASCDAIFGDKTRSWGISRGVIGGLDRIWVFNWDNNADRVGIVYTPGEWVHIALVHAGGTLKAYKDGLPAGSVASGATPAIAAQSVLHIGGVISNATKNWTFGGDIDEVQIWNIARTDAEIDAGKGGVIGGESGLVAYYRMSNGLGLSLTDDSGHGWTGILKDGGSGVPADGPITWVAGVFSGGVIPVNTPPVADPQSITSAEDTVVPITLTAWDADGDGLTFQVVTQPAHGSLTGSGANRTYTPVANFNGPDSFTFVANDGRVDSAPATVALTITAVDDLPVATDDAAMVEVDTSVVVSVLTNDVEVDGETLTITQVGDPAHGVVTYDLTQVTYVPDPGYLGADSFSYTMTDGISTSSAMVTVTVYPAGGSAGYALEFDGVSDFVAIGHAAEIMAPGWQSTKTISMWVKPGGGATCQYGTPDACDSIFGDRPQWWGITIGPVGSQNKIWMWNFDGRVKSVGIPYVAGEWIHIAMVHSGGILSAYKNGVLVGSVSSGATRQPITGAFPTLTFGGVIMASTSWAFKGDIDELAVWNVARTAGEIADDMTGPLTGAESGLAAYYQMSEGSGPVTADVSGHGWTGTLFDGYQQIPADGPILWVPSGAFIVP